uniref:DUF5689 domain-containing protein n=1 Tax=Flavobacterium sp. TaxID=239 RepID=UPI00404A5310
MKTNILKSIFSIALLSAFFTSCVNDDDYGIPNLDCVDPGITAEVTADQLYAQATANVQQYPFNINGPEYVEAYVVSSDEGGNFFKSLSLQTVATAELPSFGFSVPIDATSLFVTYEPGRKVYVRLNRQYFNISNGSLIIGDIFINQSSGAASVGRLSAATYGNVVIRSCDLVNEDELVSFKTITEALNDNNLNKLIELTDVQFAETALGTTYYDVNNVVGGATNHNLVDADGNSIIFRTSSFARYAGSPVDADRGSVRGVLTKFGSDYQFIARTINDIKLDQPRLAPIYAENFEGVPTGTTSFIGIPGWTNVNMNGGSTRWTGRIFSNNKYAQMSAFNSNEAVVDARLITPAINLDNSSNEFMRFGYKTGFANGIALSVWYSTDYDGSGTVAAVNAATWTNFDLNLDVQDVSYSSTFYSSGSIDLSTFTGDVYIAFRYQGSTSGITTTYQIDDIELFGGN